MGAHYRVVLLINSSFWGKLFAKPVRSFKYCWMGGTGHHIPFGLHSLGDLVKSLLKSDETGVRRKWGNSF